MRKKRVLAGLLAGCLISVAFTACKPGDDTLTVSGTGSAVSPSESETMQSGDWDRLTFSDLGSNAGQSSSDSTVTESGKKPGGTASVQHQGNNSKSPSSSESSAGAIKQLKIWGNENDSALRVAVSDYERMHPGVRFKIISPASCTVDMLKMEIQAGKEPDIVMLDHTYMTALGSEGVLKDLTQYGANSLKNKFLPNAWDAVTMGKAVYSLPHNGNTIALMYNKSMLSKAGKTPPADYASFVNTGKAITSAYPGKAAFTMPMYRDLSAASAKNWMGAGYLSWLWRCGGEVLTKNNTQAAFHSAAGVEALNKIIGILDEDGFCTTGEYAEDKFFNGDVGMAEMGAWYIPMLMKDKHTTIGAAELPVLKQGVPNYSMLGLFSVGVVSQSKYPDLAYNFLKVYTTNKSYQLQYAKQSSQLPALAEALKDSAYNDPMWKAYISQYAKSKCRPGVKNWDLIELAISDAVSDALQGKKSPEAALNSAAQKANALLKD